MAFLDRNSANKQRLRRNAQRMRGTALTDSITLVTGGGIISTPEGLKLDLDTKGALLTSDGSNVVELGPGADGRLLESRASEAAGLRWIELTEGETPTGFVDGTNATFALSGAPLNGSLELTVNGVAQAAPNDYSISGATITFAAGAIPETGDVLRANFRKA